MSIIKVIPPPVQEDNFSGGWKFWLVELKKSISNLTSFSWSLIDFTNSNITNITTRNHNNLQNYQGGTTNEYYHLSASQYTDLTDGGDTILHKHLDSFGEMYFNSTVSISIATPSIAYEVSSGFTSGELHNVSFGSSYYLSVATAGKYIITWSMSVDTTTALDNIEGGTMINGTESGKGICFATIASANSIESLSGTLILNLSANDQISLYVKNNTAARNISIENASITIRKLIT